MQFLYPNFLWALLALSIPIIIHLFYFRRFKKVHFTNVRFLKEIKEETSTRNKLKNLLVLLSRLLALALIVLAFARPFWSSNGEIKKGNNAISIFVDNSFSMNAGNSGVQLLSKAKSKAEEIVKSYSESDRFQIITNDFEGRHQRLVTRENALSFIQEISESPKVRPISQVLNRQGQLLEKYEDNKISYLVSDFQSQIVDNIEIRDTSLEVNLVPIQSLQASNVSIDSVWFDAIVPMIDQNNKLLIKVTNHSDQDRESLKLSIKKDDEEKPISVLDLPARSSTIDTFELPIFRTGIHKAEILIADYPIQFDDEYFISFEVDPKIRILAVNQSEANKYLTALFDGLDHFVIENASVNRLDYQSFGDYQLIVLNDLVSLSSGLVDELEKYVKLGGKLLVFPAEKAVVDSYNDLLKTLKANTIGDRNEGEVQVSKLNDDEFVFNGVFEKIGKDIKLPKAELFYSRSSLMDRLQENLLTFKNDKPYLTKNTFEKGIVYVCSAPLDEEKNDLVLNPEIFVPMLYKMSLAKVEAEKLAYTIGKDNVLELKEIQDKKEQIVKIKGVDEFIPGQSQIANKLILNINNQIDKSGYYLIQQGDQSIKNLAFNYSRRESNTSLVRPDDLQASFKGMDVNIFNEVQMANFGEVISQKDKGLQLWKWCIIMALIFLGVESLLLRFWKN